MSLKRNQNVRLKGPVLHFQRFFDAPPTRFKTRHTLCYGLARPDATHDLGHPPAPPDAEGVPLRQLQMSVVASKKGVGKRAVHRNRAKRRLRMAVQEVLSSLPHESTGQSQGRQNLEWVLMANKSCLDCSWPELVSDVRAQWDRLFNERQTVQFPKKKEDTRGSLA